MMRDSVKEILLIQSPYLSDEVLLSVMDSSSGFSEANIGDIIVANSPISTYVQDTINSLNLSSTVISQINAAQTGTSVREETKSRISFYSSRCSFTKNETVRYFLNYSSPATAADSILEVAEDSTSDMDDMSADMYIKRGNYAKADSIINLLSQNADKDGIVKLKEVLETLTQNAEPLDSLLTNPIDLQKVNDVANNDRLEGYTKAQIILSLIYGTPYYEPIDDILIRQERSRIIAPQESTLANRKGSYLYPNPNNGVMQLDYQLTATDVGLLKIMDLEGKLIASYPLDNTKTIMNINQSALTNGVYLYQVLVNNQVINSNKLVIIKN